VEALRSKRVRHREPPTALTGALVHFGLATLLTVLEMERRTGVLELRGADQTARVCLRAGQVVHVSISGTDLRGVEAILILLGWVDGGFIFRVGEVTASDEVSLPTSMLLLEAARRADEMAA
jgi:two-component system, OmpR family, response regulator